MKRDIKRIKRALTIRGKKILIIIECIFSKESEKKKVLRNLLHTRLIPMFPYDFTAKYDKKTIKIEWDDDYPYVMHSGKRLYLKKGWGIEKCQKYYNNLCIEQDDECAHKYLTEPKRYPIGEDIVADIGAAEGIFGLDIIDAVQKLYLFECDDEWIQSLKKTFEPWKDKVVIVEKYVSDYNEDKCVTLDEYFKDMDITYIKADIEGAEQSMLRGAELTLINKIKKALLCVYHNQADEGLIREIMERRNFDVELNNGYVLNIYDNEKFKHPFFRHGILYAQKSNLESQ